MGKGKTGRKKKIVLLILILAASAAVLLGVAVRRSRTKKAEPEETEEIRRRTIMNSVGGSGTIGSAVSDAVTSDMIGSRVKAVYFSVGDSVHAGDTLAEMDTSTITEQIARLQAEKQQLAADRAAGQENLNNAEQSLNDVLTGYYNVLKSAAENAADFTQDMSGAASGLNEALQEYRDLLAQYGQGQDSTQPGQNSGQDQNNGQQGQENTAGTPDGSGTDGTVPSADDIRNAAESAGSAIRDAAGNAGASSASIVPEIPAPGQIDLSGLDISGVYDSLIKTLDREIGTLEERLSHAVITASSDGTVTEVRAAAGDLYFGTEIMLVEDLSKFEISAEISEYDIPDVAVGMPVVIKTDATRDEELSGTVCFVALKATSGGVTDMLSGAQSLLSGSLSGSGSSGATYQVKISVDTANDRLRPGMNATISIITAEADDVLSVPYEAVQTEDGESFIEVRKDGQNEKIPVTTGLEGTYYIEIQTDADIEGEDVVIPDSKGQDSVEEIMNLMGSDGGF